MENHNQLSEEEIINPEQFQVGRNPVEQEDEADQDKTSGTEEAGYTPGETEFADGEGTRLDQQSEELKIDEEIEDFEIDPKNDPDAGYSSDQDDADLENSEDGPA